MEGKGVINWLIIPKQGRKGEIREKREKGKNTREAGEKADKKDGNIMWNLTACSSTLHIVKSGQMRHAQLKWYFEAARSDYSL